MQRYSLSTDARAINKNILDTTGDFWGQKTRKRNSQNGRHTYSYCTDKKKPTNSNLTINSIVSLTAKKNSTGDIRPCTELSARSSNTSAAYGELIYDESVPTTLHVMVINASSPAGKTKQR